MKTAALTALMLACMTVSAFAQDTSALCKLLKTENATAGAAYQPGVDVNGHPVVPADLSSSVPSMMPDVVKIPLTIDLAKRLNTAPPAGTEMESNMGMIEIRKDGSVTWNGQDLTPQAQATCGMATALPVAQPVPPVAPKAQPPAPVEPQHAVISPYKPGAKADWQSAIQPANPVPLPPQPDAASPSDAGQQNTSLPAPKLEPGSVSSSGEPADLSEPAQQQQQPSSASSVIKQEPDQPVDKDVIWGQGN